MRVVLAKSPSILDAAGDEARRISAVWWFMFILAVVVYVLVSGLVIASIVRHRRAEAPDPAERGGAFIWLGGLLMPIVILAVLAGVTVTTTAATPRSDPASFHIDVTGHQWWWDVRYPASDVRTANEIHLPEGRTVDIGLRSDDVAHSFWVPQIAGKLDLIPGQTNHLRVRARRTGTFIGECAEYCGLQHANMRLTVVVQPTAEFTRWLDGQRQPPAPPAGSLQARGERVFLNQSCAGCHTIRGTQADGKVGPDLTLVGEREWLAGLAFRNTPSNLRRWILDPASFKRGVIMPPSRLSDTQLRALVAYLESRR